MADVIQLEAYSRDFELIPLNHVKLSGAINNASNYAIGDHDLIVDGFDAGESALVEKGDYVKIGSYEYRICDYTLTTSLLTNIVIYPALRAAALDDAAIEILGSDSTTGIDFFGDISEDGVVITTSKDESKLINQSGVEVKGREWISDEKIEVTFIDNTVDNALFFKNAKLTWKTGSINSTTYNISNQNVGIKDKRRFKVIIKDLLDPTNESRQVVANEAIMFVGEIMGGSGKESFVKYPVKFSVTPDSSNLLTIYGDTSL